tara:strand:+ start:321 stop:533 length:213 start_codon:yes stop_codon:yes gene_type:complete
VVAAEKGQTKKLLVPVPNMAEVVAALVVVIVLALLAFQAPMAVVRYLEQVVAEEVVLVTYGQPTLKVMVA